MEFAAVFAVIFLLVFAAAMLAFLLWNALRSGCTGTFDIYVKPSEDLEDLIICAQHDTYIGVIYIIADENNESLRELSERLSQKYDNVKVINKSDW